MVVIFNLVDNLGIITPNEYISEYLITNTIFFLCNRRHNALKHIRELKETLSHILMGNNNGFIYTSSFIKYFLKSRVLLCWLNLWLKYISLIVLWLERNNFGKFASTCREMFKKGIYEYPLFFLNHFFGSLSESRISLTVIITQHSNFKTRRHIAHNIFIVWKPLSKTVELLVCK